MSERRRALERIAIVRTSLFVLGVLLMIGSPAVGVIPGPGGIIVFAAGLALVLRYSQWAKRQYVKFKRSHPKKGAWADWGLRRQSHKRREALRKAGEAEPAEDMSSHADVRNVVEAPRQGLAD